jgi:hypothetical protein
VLRVRVLLVLVASLAVASPGHAQSLESQGYRFNKAHDAWEPVPAYLQPLSEGDAEFIKVLAGQGYYFNRFENVWRPRAHYL